MGEKCMFARQEQMFFVEMTENGCPFCDIETNLLFYQNNH